MSLTFHNPSKGKVIRIFNFFFVVFLVLTMTSLTAFCEYPEREISLIVPWSAGGGTDTICRFIADKMEKDLGKPVIVVNKTGGGGLIGFRAISGAKPDGYTIGANSISMILQKYAAIDYVDRTQVAPIAIINIDPASFTINAGLAWKNLKEALDYAKKNPGKVRVSNSGPGAIWHIAAAMLAQKAGVKFTHVPYKGGNPAAVAAAGGHVEATTTSPAEVSSLARAGKLKILAISSEKRDPNFPNVPTFQEAGVDLVFGTWRGVITAPNTPKAIIDRLNASISKVVNSQEYKDFLNKGNYGWAYQGSTDFAATMKINEKDLAEVVPSLGLKK
jgi:tripartite-type tricarboxylate transporter receptor subunit TctC